jgi:hypothetical protein
MDFDIFKKNTRFFVPDLSAQARGDDFRFIPRYVFVAESPHLSEVEPVLMKQRRPLCGKAGQVWWPALTQRISGFEQSIDPLLSYDFQKKVCRAGSLFLINAVQYPLDPKIVLHQPAADPVSQIGFSKVSPTSYKNFKKTQQVQQALDSLRMRLNHPLCAHTQVVSLGNDAKWFVEQVIDSSRHCFTIPHPSAWWRQGGKLRQRAEGLLDQLFIQSHGPSEQAYRPLLDIEKGPEATVV